MIHRKATVLITGIALLYIVSGSHAQQRVIPPRDFFNDTETGDPVVRIVVGREAAQMDIISGTIVAVRLFSLVDLSKPREHSYTRSFSVRHAVFDPFICAPSQSDAQVIENLGFPAVDVPNEGPYLLWKKMPLLLDNTLKALWYLDDGMWGNNDDSFQPWETHEEIQIRFDDLQDKENQYMNGAAVYGGNTAVYQQYPQQWCSVPGLIYRADNIFAPPMISVNVDNAYCDDYPFTPAHLFVPEPFLVYNEMLPQFKLFNTVFTVVDAGPVLDINPYTGGQGPLHGTPYVVTGEPHLEEVYLYKNELREFLNYTVELESVNKDYDTAYVRISKDGKLLKRLLMRFDPGNKYLPKLKDESFPFVMYENCRDLNNNGKVDSREYTSALPYDYDNDGIPDYDKWVMEREERDSWAGYTWKYYIDQNNDASLLFNTVDFFVDSVKTFIASGGELGIAINVYWLENPQYWYTSSCSDPWIREPNFYHLFLDAYESGWDTDYHQPPGTGLWPTQHMNHNTFIGNGFLDSNDGHIGYEYTYLKSAPDLYSYSYSDLYSYFPEQRDYDRDKSDLNDCRHSDCSLELNCTDFSDIEDPVMWHGPGVTLVEINVCSCDILYPSSDDMIIRGPSLTETPLFTIKVTDRFFAFNDGDSIEYKLTMTLAFTETYISHVDFDVSCIVFLDSEFNFAQWKSSHKYNLILVGGPVANPLVRKLINEGHSVVDWYTSPGEWEYIKAPYGTSDILIIAGADRKCTREAVYQLIDQL
ncbi:MAG: S-layer protein [Theionarchaea archaeon]|nr:S-layer protein [Theionarchaea archaeon]